jgi:L-alanine-DL-glutamate epimerase-like enolase superfamily enzyme
MVVTVETDAGITGVGEGGSKDLLEQAAGRLIGKDPQFIELLWQDMNRAFFYPAGRERTDAIGALDLALWDIKGKVQKLPIHELLGGMVRNHCECYNTAGIIPGITPGMPISARPGHCEAGYRAFHSQWTSDYHLQHKRALITLQRNAQQQGGCRQGTVTGLSTFISDSICPMRFAAVTKSERPLFVEDPLHRLPPGSPILEKSQRSIGAGEEWGNRWDFNPLVENHDAPSFARTPVSGHYRDDEDCCSLEHLHRNRAALYR